jgi:hypothetical protein
MGVVGRVGAAVSDDVATVGLIRSLDELHPVFRPVVDQWLGRCDMAGLDLIVTETRRTWAVQTAYYLYGRAEFADVFHAYVTAGLRAPNPTEYHVGQEFIKTKAKPGMSWHGYGLALDFAPMVNGEIDWIYSPGDAADHWDELAQLAKDVGMTWGGDWRTFKDRPHVEYHPGYGSPSEALALYRPDQDNWKIPIPKVA